MNYQINVYWGESIYAQISESISHAVEEYINDVRGLQFPDKQHSFSIENNVMEQMERMFKNQI